MQEDSQGRGAQELLERRQVADENYQEGMSYLSGHFTEPPHHRPEEGIPFLKEACRLYHSFSDKNKCHRAISSCIRSCLGITGGPNVDIPYFLSGVIISDKEVHTMVQAYKQGSSVSRVVQKKSRGGMTIAKLMFALLDEHGLDVKLDEVLPDVLKLKPNSKFDDSHLGYYKSNYKKVQKTEEADWDDD